MTISAQIHAKLRNLVESGGLPASQCGQVFRKYLSPLLDTDVLSWKRSGAGSRLVVNDADALRDFLCHRFPETNLPQDAGSRVVGVGRFRDTKTVRNNSSEIIALRVWRNDALLKNGKPVGAAKATATHGMFSFPLTHDCSYELRGQCALVENPAVFAAFEKLHLNVGAVIYGHGRISNRTIDWLARTPDADFCLLHLPDYDPVGLSEFQRLRSRLCKRVILHLPSDLDKRFARFSKRKLLANRSSQATLAKLRTLDIPEIRRVVELIDRNNAAASEGINLHRRAHLMVNYDLPWNPNRIEQRFGRIHRIGQPERCHLWNLVAIETREGHVFHRLLDKLSEQRKALGGAVFDVLGKMFKDRSLRDLLIEASVPASSDAGTASPSAGVHDEEVGGARGRQALVALKNAIGRVEASWRPANAEESFEIVRRRLFQPITDPAMFTARDNVAKAFCELYRNQHQEFPPECREADYERKLKAAYPIHPEIFERLYQDWSGLVKFQRTRGVLRLMASVIHALWEQGDKSPLIQPAHVPLLDQRVISEIIHFLPDGWESVIEKDVDGESSLPLKLDREKPNLGRHSACRRVARTLFLASAPTPGAANRGVEDRRIKLGCVQPGESPAIFGDALRHLAQSATYLYQDNARYWYSTQPTVTKLAEDRAEQMKRDPDTVADEIKKRVQEDLKSRGDFLAIRAFPKNNGEIPDEMETQLVVLGVDHAYAKESGNPAQAQTILDARGNSPRLFKNALVFLVADRTRLAELDEAMRFHLAWASIENDKDQLGLDGFQMRQVTNQKATWNTAIKGRLGETFCWLFFPTQPTSQGALEWQAVKLSGPDPLAVRASKKLRSDTQMASQYAPTLLRQDLDKIPLWRENHVSVKQLVEDYAKYPYLQRLRDPAVLIAGIQDGVSRTTWTTETFAIADSWDEKRQRYVGLRGNCHTTLDEDSSALLVKPEIALRQMEADKPSATTSSETTASSAATASQNISGKEASANIPGNSAKLTRFFGSVKLDPSRLNRDAAQVSAEVIQHLTSLIGADVEVTMEIQARVAEGIPENVVRTISENCRTLKFKNEGFEKD